MNKMNPILRNLLVTLGVVVMVVVLGVAAKFGGQLVDYILKNGTETLLVAAIVAVISAILFGVVEMIASNRKKKSNVNDDWQGGSKFWAKGGPNGKGESFRPFGLFLLKNNIYLNSYAWKLINVYRFNIYMNVNLRK